MAITPELASNPRIRCFFLSIVAVAGISGCSSNKKSEPKRSGSATSRKTDDSSTDDNGSGDSQAGAKTEFRVFPDEGLWSGFGGTDKPYKVPVLALNGSGAVTWEVEDPTVAVLDSQEGSNATFRTLKAGETNIIAKSGGKTATVTLHVTAYTKNDIDTGTQRYMNAADASNPACNSCHAMGSGFDHTPTEVDADDDEAVINTFTTGKDPEGRPVRDEGHSWKVTDAQKKGLMAFLRSLPPQGYPKPDHEK